MPPLSKQRMRLLKRVRNLGTPLLKRRTFPTPKNNQQLPSRRGKRKATNVSASTYNHSRFLAPRSLSASDKKKDEILASASKSQKVDEKSGEENAERKKLPEKIFGPAELRSNLKPVLDKLLSMRASMPFKSRLRSKNPEKQHAIDLSVISSKLRRGLYKNPWDFNDDMWLMFENAWMCHRKNSKVYSYCNKLSQVFVEQINPVMKKLGYCCGQKLSFTPPSLYCDGNSLCTIARDQYYHVYEATSSQQSGSIPGRYLYCTGCFNALPESGVNSHGDSNEISSMVPKSEFVQKKNDEIDLEPFEKCIKCYRMWHRVCALYNKKVFKEEFICATCRRENGTPPVQNRFTAENLPHCMLSRFLEDRVRRFLRAHSADNDHKIIIRVVSSVDKETEVKPRMKQIYGPLGFPEKFPYRSKTIFAFEIIDGLEVCFLGFLVQEYGSNCPPPNARKVYLAYLDSVHFFQPRQLRTDVYHEILLGYLNYVKILGYTMAYFWACPPAESDDYIFNRHPPEQKIPKAKNLENWYKRLLEKGLQEHIVYNYKNIYRQAKQDNLLTPMALPYFEGDFWPTSIENCIGDVSYKDSPVAKKRQKSISGEDGGDNIACVGNSTAITRKHSKKRIYLNQNPRRRKNFFPCTVNNVINDLYANLEKYKDGFFVVRLISPQAEPTAPNNEIKDPDPLIESALMYDRDTFLAYSRQEHWEFSSLRRAKYSTMCFCHVLHNEVKSNGYSYTCNSCRGAAVWHCEICEDLDFCNQCHETVSHPHELVEINKLYEGDKSTQLANRPDSVRKTEKRRATISRQANIMTQRRVERFSCVYNRGVSPSDSS